MSDTQSKHRYTAYYCEENIWHLCQEAQFQSAERYVICISNPKKSCALLWQRAVPFGEVIFWDYHVIMACKSDEWMIWDLDTRIGIPTQFDNYFELTYPMKDPLASPHAPFFKVIPADEFARSFSSDRSHMLDARGRFLQPPPEWPAIINSTENNLFDYIDMDRTDNGDVLTLTELKSRFL